VTALPRDAPSALPGGLRLIAAVPLGGGDVAAVWRGTLDDGRTVVVKRGPTDATVEAEGLTALAEAGAPTPDVLAVDTTTLVLEHVQGPGDLRSLGRALATVHATTAAAFGWHRDGFIGPLPQVNQVTDDWPTFVRDARLLPLLGGLPEEVAARLQRAADEDAIAAELAHQPAPSLVHGDLWSGNIVGERWLIDPAVHHADREVDLAMLDLFGGVPPALQRGYDEVAPLPQGWERRRLVLQLVPLLVHVRLFGRGYLGGVVARLDRLGW
jgi:fructosamine-3-kinase